MSLRLHLAGVAALAGIVSSIALASPALASPSTQRVPAPTPHAVGVGSNPYAVAIAQNLGKAFVVNDGSVSVVSLLTHRELAEFGTGNVQGQNAIALVRGNTQAYITDYQLNKVTVIDTEMNTVVKRITVGDSGGAVVKANTSHGQLAYVGYVSTARLTGIATSSGKIVQQVKLPAAAQTLATVPGGKKVWVGSGADGRVFVVDTAKAKVTKIIDVRRFGPVTAIAFTPGHKRAWVAGPGGVSVVDVSSGKLVKSLPILKLFSSPAPNMGGLVLSGSGRYAYVENSTFPDAPHRGQIAAINTKTYQVTWRATTGVEPVTLAIDTTRNVLYAPNYADDTVTYLTLGQ